MRVAHAGAGGGITKQESLMIRLNQSLSDIITLRICHVADGNGK